MYEKNLRNDEILELKIVDRLWSLFQCSYNSHKNSYHKDRRYKMNQFIIFLLWTFCSFWWQQPWRRSCFGHFWPSSTWTDRNRWDLVSWPSLPSSWPMKIYPMFRWLFRRPKLFALLYLWRRMETWFWWESNEGS